MKVLILGGGITGLSAAWYLQKQSPHVKITLLEKENRIGGWIRSSCEEGYLFEQGPRTFQMARSPHLLELIRELNLTLIPSDPAAKKRFILHKGKLRTPLSFLPMMIPRLIREFFVPPSEQEDESIYDFASRRFSPKMAELLFDPLTLGIYAGDIRKLSIRSCFPTLYKWEREKGSVLKGLFSMPKSKMRGLFTLKGGMETLIHALKQKLSIEVVLNSSVEMIGESEVFAKGKTWNADRIISALPQPFPHRSIWVVHLVFSGDVLRKKGFGYLVPTVEKEALLGCIFDSVIFPDGTPTTRLTAMVRSEEEKPLEVALEALSRHIGINQEPIYRSTFFAKEAIPQLEVGCGYMDGISVDACIARGQKLIHFL